MKIENMGVRISEVPYLGSIVIADGQAQIGGSRHYEIAEVREMRDALDAAIREMEPAAPVTLFALGQVLTGDEDPPIGTVVKDEDETCWTLKPGGWTCGGSKWTLDRLARGYGPITIVSLP